MARYVSLSLGREELRAMVNAYSGSARAGSQTPLALSTMTEETVSCG